LFWLSLVGDLYIYYRLILDLSKRHLIKRRPLGEDIKAVTGMGLTWNVLRSSDKKINIAKYFNEPALNLINQAYILAKKNKQSEVTAINLITVLSTDQNVRLILGRLGIDYQEYINKIKRLLIKIPPKSNKDLDFDRTIREALIAAYYEAYKNRLQQISSVELLLGLLNIDQTIQDLFVDLGIDIYKVSKVADWIHLNRQLVEWIKRNRARAALKPKSHMNRAMTARPTKVLDSVSQDFTLKAKYGHFLPLIGREKEVAATFRILKEGRGNVILLGESGVGKTTIIEGVAQLMASEDVPPKLQDKRLVVLDPGVLIAGAQGIGGVEQRMLAIINEIILAGNVILVIEDIHNLLGARSTQSGTDAGEILMNFLSQGYIQVIGTSTIPEYQKYIEDKETFLRRFQIVNVPEMSIDDTIKVLEAKSGFTEAKNKVYFSYDALEACAVLTDRYIKDRHLPAKALDIMEEAAIYTLEKKGENNIVTRDDVAEILSEKTNIKVSAITESEADKLLHLEEMMHRRIVGQDEAVSAIAKALRRAREELRDPNRPIASFLFLGPTGVGKTETAKTIAEVYFGNENNMIRLDMSEYQKQDSVVKMIGDANTKGYLTEAIRQKPFSIVLLDEIEKAHPDILNLFLQVLDDGRLTDGLGRTVDFTNTIIIATSNAASQAIQMGQEQGLSPLEIYESLLDGYLDQYFRPEFLNRFDKIVVFTALQFEEVVEITRRLLAKLAASLEERGIHFEVTDEAVIDLARHGYSPKFGARPLRRLLQDTVDDALAKLMLKQKLDRRDRVILYPQGRLEVKKAEPI